MVPSTPERDPVAQPATRRGRTRDTHSPSTRSRGRRCHRRSSPTRGGCYRPRRRRTRSVSRRERRRGHPECPMRDSTSTSAGPPPASTAYSAHGPQHPSPRMSSEPANATRDPSGEIAAPRISIGLWVICVSDPSACSTNRSASRRSPRMMSRRVPSLDHPSGMNASEVNWTLVGGSAGAAGSTAHRLEPL